MTVGTQQLGVSLFDDAYLQQPYPLYDRMLAAGPVHRIGESGFSAVCGWDAVTDAVARTRDAKVAYTAGRRLYGNVEGRLLFSFDRATEDHELQPYLWAQLERR